MPAYFTTLRACISGFSSRLVGFSKKKLGLPDADDTDKSSSEDPKGGFRV